LSRKRAVERVLLLLSYLMTVVPYVMPRTVHAGNLRISIPGEAPVYNPRSPVARMPDPRDGEVMGGSLRAQAGRMNARQIASCISSLRRP